MRGPSRNGAGKSPDLIRRHRLVRDIPVSFSTSRTRTSFVSFVFIVISIDCFTSTMLDHTNFYVKKILIKSIGYITTEKLDVCFVLQVP